MAGIVLEDNCHLLLRIPVSVLRQTSRPTKNPILTGIIQLRPSVDYGLGANPNLAPDGTRFYKNVPGDISEFRGLKAPSLRGTSSYSSFSRVVRFAASTKQGTGMSGRPSARCWRYFDGRYGIVPHLERSHRGMPFESAQSGALFLGKGCCEIELPFSFRWQPNIATTQKSTSSPADGEPAQTLPLYELKITLRGGKPAIWRRVQVPRQHQPQSPGRCLSGCKWDGLTATCISSWMRQ